MPAESDGGDDLNALREAILRIVGEDRERISLARGEILFRQGDPADALYFVVSGRLRATIARPGCEGIAVGEIGPGEPVGELGILTGQERGAEVSAIEDAELLRVSREVLARAADDAPETLGPLAAIIGRRLRRNQLAAVLPGLFGSLDDRTIEALESLMEWRRLPGGETLFRQGDPGDSLYVLLSGRLRVIAEDPDGDRRVLNDVGPGESVGEMALLTGDPRSATVLAVRDSQLVRISSAAWETIRDRHPRVILGMARILARRLARGGAPRPKARAAGTIAFVPAGPDVPLESLVDRLANALPAFGPALRLSAAGCDRLLGMPGAAQLAPDAPRSLRLEAWLDEQEARHRFVLLEADASASNWTRRCLRAADRVVLVARAGADPSPGPIEAALAEHRATPHAAPWMLVLLHADASRLPSGTSAWLGRRPIQEHLHIRLHGDADIGRLARRIAGRSIGIALGGGGARGFAHLGVLRALREAGIPIDVVSGTSMGAVIGALHAMGHDYETVLEMSERVFVRGRPHREFTVPVFSIIRSRKLDRLIRSVYGDADFEDLWYPFTCVSSNLTTTEMVTHRRGSVWKAVRASASLPGVFVPVIDGHDLLVDGGVINNLPGDLLRRSCGGPVLVVEVSRETEWTMDLREFPSPWRTLASRFLPRGKREKVPGILSILLRTIVVGSDHRAREVKADADLCFQPPIQNYGVLEFDRFREIAQTGYAYAKRMIDGLDDPALRASLGLPSRA
ncbi:MAG: cyclic nucleotide-binding domain-containing protein [Planctomycetes bacterium]|nr:cyclic nucleotide-binding domain-containing protein [Planctomycetota bacterium]